MTTTTHPIASTHRAVAALIAAALAVGLTVALMLALTTRGATAPTGRPAVGASTPPITESFSVGTVNSGPDNPTHVVSTLCSELANATPGSPAAFRLADTALGSC